MNKNANLKTIAGYRTVNAFVEAKIERFSSSKKDFAALYELMFSERDNIMFEKSEGYRIVKTTYGECRASIERRASALSKRLSGVENGAPIGVYMQNSREWIEAFWAVLICGFRPMLMNLRLGEALLKQVVSDYGVRAVITDNESGADLGVPMIRLNDIAPSDALSDYALNACFGDEILIMSSGTGESLKLCAYSAEELYTTLRDSFDIIKKCKQIKAHYKGELKLLAFLPFYHVFGFVAMYLWFAFFSRTFVLLNDMRPETIVNTIRRHEVTHIFAVPLLWNKIYEQATKAIRERGEKTAKKFDRAMALTDKLKGVPFLSAAFSRLAFREVRANIFGESIRFLITGGSEIRPCVLKFINSIGYRLVNGYGMTEIGITSVELSSDRRIIESGSIGLPFSSVEYEIDSTGQLLVRGGSLARSVMEGGRVVFSGGWFKTGDMAEYRSGRYYIHGRMDDIVIAPNGENLNPVLIEAKLEIDGIKELALVGVEAADGNQPVLVASVPPYCSDKALKRLRSELIQRLSELELDNMIGRIEFVREPLTADGDIKPNRMKIAKRLASGGFAVVRAEGADNTLANGGINPVLLSRVRALFAATLNKNESDIADDADFFLDCGGTSLDYFSFVSGLQEEFSIRFPAERERSLASVQEIANYIAVELNDDDQAV